MNQDAEAGPLLQAVQRLDGALDAVARLFLVLANGCLGLMLLGTFATITLRLFDVSFYWIWPWTMQFFVWMSFIGFFVVYRLGKDIAVDFLVLRLGSGAMVATRYMVAALIMTVMGVMLWQMPTILASQVGVIDALGRTRALYPLRSACRFLRADLPERLSRRAEGAGRRARTAALARHRPG
jgi:TRAP-type C4-dicarboxylate transport system permease small subunit